MGICSGRKKRPEHRNMDWLFSGGRLACGKSFPQLGLDSINICNDFMNNAFHATGSHTSSEKSITPRARVISPRNNSRASISSSILLESARVSHGNFDMIIPPPASGIYGHGPVIFQGFLPEPEIRILPASGQSSG